MDMTAITGLQQSVGAVFGLAKAATGAAVDHELKGRLIEIQQGILDIQAKLGDAQADRIELLREVQELRDKLRASEDAKAKLDGYELHAIEPGSFLYRSKESAGHVTLHFACPTCFNAGQVVVLQQEGGRSTETGYRCYTCKFYLSAGPRNRHTNDHTTGGSGGGWMAS